MKTNLTLKEKFMLLCYHPEKGRFLTNATWLDYGLAGAALLELAAQNKIIEEGGKLILRDPKPTGDKALDVVVEKIHNKKKIRSFKIWIGLIAQGEAGRKLRNLTRQSLIDKRILKEESKKLLLIFSYRRYPQINGRLRREMISEMHKIVIRRQIGSKEMMMLIGLVGASNMVGSFFLPEERKTAKKRIKEIISGNEIAVVLDSAVAAVQAAITGALITTTIVTAAAT